MSGAEAEFLAAIEGHDLASLRLVLDNGLDPRARFRGRSPIQWLTEMYTRSDNRRDHDVYDNIRRLLVAAGRTPPPLVNVPNRYLGPRPNA